MPGRQSHNKAEAASARVPLNKISTPLTRLACKCVFGYLRTTTWRGTASPLILPIAQPGNFPNAEAKIASPGYTETNFDPEPELQRQLQSPIIRPVGCEEISKVPTLCTYDNAGPCETSSPGHVTR